MKPNPIEAIRRVRRQAGNAMITALVALIAVSSLAIDGGMIWAARSQLQNAVDAAALAGALNMIDTATPGTTLRWPESKPSVTAVAR